MRSSDTQTFSSSRLLFSLLFVSALLLPALLVATGHDQAAGKTVKKMEWPGLQTDALLDPDYYKAWIQYARGRVTAPGPLFKAKNWIDYRIFAMTETKSVHVGRGGWLFDSETVRDYRKTGCREAADIKRLILSLRAAEHIIEATGRRFVFTVAPGKSTIYPEYMGSVPRQNDCGRSRYDILVETLDEYPLASFVRLDTILGEAKAAQRLLYSQTGSNWNADGARVAAHILMQRLTGRPTMEPVAESDDLTPAIMRSPTSPPDDEHRTAARAHQQRSTAVIYGGQMLNQLLPYLQPRFERIDVITSTSLPSRLYGENLSAYDTIVLVLSEAGLSEQRINLDLIGNSLDAKTMAEVQQPISLDAVLAGDQMALHRKSDHLVIKSMGADAHWTLPPIPGSDNKSLRLVQFDLTAPLNDELIWAIEDHPLYGGAHALRAGTNRLYLPLPIVPQVRIRIQTGQNTGIFKLQNATLLTFGDIPEWTAEAVDSPLNQWRQVGTTKAQGLPVDEAPTALETSPRIQLNDFEFKQVFQRRGTASDIIVAGVYQGIPGAVEARVLNYDTDDVLMPWTVVDNTPDNGIFMGILPGVPQGGWYRLAVRFRDNPEIAVRGESPWGVGMLIACIGQSNMKEWFHTGDIVDPNPLLSIHRDGKWNRIEKTGNGAEAFGQWLISALDIPVGLLDYSVNGSGLHPKANWGTGHWTDRGKNSIYQQFIDGVAAAGGALEYIVWMQGEADAARRTISGHQYLHALESFISRQVRQDIDNGSHKANLPFLVVGMVKRPVGADAPHQAIRNALVAATRQIEDTYLGATTLDLKLQGRQHLAPEAYMALGQRVAQTILNLLGKAEYHRGPAVDHIEKIDDRTIDLYLTHRGGHDFSPQDKITGFQVFSGKTALAIESAVRQDDRCIRILLHEPTQGQLHLTYLYGARPDTRGVVRDNTELQLPLEPFEASID